MDLISAICERMTNERLMFVYRGVVSKENSVPLLTLLEKEMENSEFGFTGRKRLFMFLLESLQNVSRHGQTNHLANMSLVVYSRINNGFSVATGNVISTAEMDDLKNRLVRINDLAPDEIRDVYRSILSTTTLSSKGGAGLGLIEMAKMTGDKLNYDFVEIDPGYSYFILSRTIDSSGMSMQTGEDGKALSVDAVAGLEQFMAENNVYLIWSGHFTPAVGNEILSLAEIKLSEEEAELNMRKRIFSILVEMIENVAKHRPRDEDEIQYGMPVVVIRMSDKAHYLTTCNLIQNTKVDQLREKLVVINSHDRNGLRSLFRESLNGQDSTTESRGSMGLITIARKSGNRLDYRFDRINDLYSYYVLTVKVSDNHSG
jgi:hypothetical protein